MVGLQEIKSRINTVSTIKKITKAMQLIATAKLIKSKNSLVNIRVYYEEVSDTFKELLAAAKDLLKLFENNIASKNLYILVTSDIGLCGAYNSNVIKLLKNSFKTDDDLIIIGQKGKLAFKDKLKKIDSFVHIGDQPNYLIASEIAKIAVSKFLANEIKTIKIIHTKYINSVSYYSKITTLLPLKDILKKENKLVVEYEPNPEKIILNSLSLYISAMVYGLMSESKVSEMSSRRVAMENSSDNAGDLIEKLSLDYNRARQSKITQEISEIVSGLDTE